MFKSAGSSLRPHYLPVAAAPRRGTIAAVAVVAVTLALMAAVGVAVFTGRPPPLDAHTGCAQGVLDQHVVFYVDLSDPIPEPEFPAVLDAIDSRARGLPVGSRLTVRALVPGSSRPTEAIFDACKPGDGSTASIWTGNRAMQADSYASTFVRPLEEARRRLRSARQRDTSPIIAALADVVNARWFAPARRHSLVVVSDLLEHSTIVDMYRPGYDFDSVRRAGYKVVLDLQGRLAGSDVMLLQTRRAEVGRYQTPAQHAFWLALMAHAGVPADRLSYVRL